LLLRNIELQEETFRAITDLRDLLMKRNLKEEVAAVDKGKEKEKEKAAEKKKSTHRWFHVSIIALLY